MSRMLPLIALAVVVGAGGAWYMSQPGPTATLIPPLLAQDAGTTVTVRPQIAEGDHLILQYSVAISAFVGKSTDPSLPPPRQQNAIESVVTIPDGYTVVVGGLRVDTEAKGTSQIPLVGDVPVLGELFKSRSNASDKSRFFVFLRANILRHDGFEDLKYLSDVDSLNAGIEDWPRNEPRVIR